MPPNHGDNMELEAILRGIAGDVGAQLHRLPPRTEDFKDEDHESEKSDGQGCRDSAQGSKLTIRRMLSEPLVDIIRLL